MDIIGKGIITKEVDDVQVAAMTMAIYLNGMSQREISDLTIAMSESGDILNFLLHSFCISAKLYRSGAFSFCFDFFISNQTYQFHSFDNC